MRSPIENNAAEIIYSRLRSRRAAEAGGKPLAAPACSRLRTGTVYAAVASALAAGFGGPASAQEGAAGVDEVTVTGSRITRDGMSTPTPVTAVSVDDLAMMSPGSVIDSLDYLPPFFLNDSPDTAASKSASAGASNVNLRGLGANRTLVLLDGRRVVPSNRLGAVDINMFPEAILERVEVVTGGASAAYGTDAVAGVVNFILDTDFDGLDVRAQAGITDRSDNENYEVSLAYGTDIGERMHLIASLDYYDAKKIETLEGRDWFRSWGLVTNPAWPASNPQYLVLPDVVSTAYTWGGLINAPGSAIHRYEFLPDGTVRPFVAGDVAAVGRGTGSQSITNGGSGEDPVTDRGGSLVPPVERGALFALLDFDVGDATTLYAQALIGRNRVNSVGTLPLGHGNWRGTIFADNAFLPQEIRDVMIAEGLESFRFERYHTTADLAQDRFTTHNDTESLTLGASSELESGALAGFRIRGHYQFGSNDNELTYIDFIRTDRLPQAMDAVRHPVTGEIVCNASLFDPANYGDCVPIDLFGQGRASQEAIDYVLEGDQVVLAKTEQQVAELVLDGEIGDGWGAGPVSLAFGAAWREEEIVQTLGPDELIALSSPGDDPARGIRGVPPAFANVADVLIFTNVSPIEGSYSVSEVFAESLLPLVADKPGLRQLDLSLAARFADYEGSGGIWAWKTGLDWRVTTDVRLRATLSRDIRAATLSERFDRQGVGTVVTDPDLGDLQYTSTQIIGGNPNLNPEEADTLTFGVVYQPSGIEGFSVSSDYYEIDISGALAQIGVQTIIDECFDGAAARCAKITRDSETGFITVVDNGFVNQDAARVAGTDLEAGYSLNLRGGATLSTRVLASWLHENSRTNLGSPKRDSAGETGANALPEFKATAYMRYSKGPFSLFAQERYIGSGTLDIDYIEGVTIDDNSIPSRYYTDVGLTYTAGGGAWELFLNVQNLFDKDPPVVASWSSFSGTGITNDRLFDFFGRRYVLGANFSF